MAKNVKAFRERTKRGRCPSCGKKGLTVARIVNGKRWRDCQYCGDSIKVETPAPAPIKDARPANCRFRLQDEGKPFPKSACESCGKTIMTGLGKACSFSPSPENRAAAPAPLNSDKDGGGEC